MKIFINSGRLSFENGTHIATYDETTGILYGTHRSGFYSCINVTRIALYKLISQGIIPTSISFKDTLHNYKELPTDDLYPHLYTIDNNAIKYITTNFDFDYFCPTLIDYKYFDFNYFTFIERAFFSPSEKVQHKITDLIKTYNITPTNTIAVLHRGNDKCQEATLADPEQWINQTKQQLDTNSRILIQTDEEITRDIVTNYFGDRCFTFKEMIFTNTYSKPENNFTDWAICFESIMRIISKCKKIITHSGNCGFIPILYRKNTRNITQLRHTGEFIS